VLSGVICRRTGYVKPIAAVLTPPPLNSATPKAAHRREMSEVFPGRLLKKFKL
jgi:hypothetical protein